VALPAVDPASRLIALVARAEPRLRDALTSAIVAAQEMRGLDELAELIELGRFDEALEAAARFGAVRLADEAAAVFTLAGRSTAQFLTDALEVVVSFDQVNERAVRVMQQERLRLIREFSAEQRAATRAAMVDGVQRGLNPRDQARAFRSSVGLTQRQQQAVIRYRQLLETGSREALARRLRDARFDRTVENAIRSGEPLTQEQVDRMVGRYRDRYVKYRAETIGRTEALRAVHSANDEAYRQAYDEGHLDPGQVARTWVTAHDERVRSSHAGLDGESRPPGEPFQGHSGPIMHPGDPNAAASETVQCRCALSTRIDAPQE
jgi:hypothetical protein